jgi:hypothetical protein
MCVISISTEFPYLKVSQHKLKFNDLNISVIFDTQRTISYKVSKYNCILQPHQIWWAHLKWFISYHSLTILKHRF